MYQFDLVTILLPIYRFTGHHKHITTHIERKLYITLPLVTLIVIKNNLKINLTIENKQTIDQFSVLFCYVVRTSYLLLANFLRQKSNCRLHSHISQNWKWKSPHMWWSWPPKFVSGVYSIRFTYLYYTVLLVINTFGIFISYFFRIYIYTSTCVYRYI